VVVVCGGCGGYSYECDSFLFQELGCLVEAVPDEGYVESASHGGSEDGGVSPTLPFLGMTTAWTRVASAVLSMEPRFMGS